MEDEKPKRWDVVCVDETWKLKKVVQHSTLNYCNLLQIAETENKKSKDKDEDEEEKEEPKMYEKLMRQEPQSNVDDYFGISLNDEKTDIL